MTTISTALATQADQQLIRDLAEMPVSGPWIEATTVSQDGQTLIAEVWDPDEDEGVTMTVELSADQLREAITTAEQRHYRLCCAEVIQSEGIDSGCADDGDTIYQTAAYGEIVYG